MTIKAIDMKGIVVGVAAIIKKLNFFLFLFKGGYTGVSKLQVEITLLSGISYYEMIL